MQRRWWWRSTGSAMASSEKLMKEAFEDKIDWSPALNADIDFDLVLRFLQYNTIFLKSVLFPFSVGTICLAVVMKKTFFINFADLVTKKTLFRPIVFLFLPVKVFDFFSRFLFYFDVPFTHLSNLLFIVSETHTLNLV